MTAVATHPSISPCPFSNGQMKHFVQFYEEDAMLADSVARFVGDGLAAGDRALLICTEEHAGQIRTQLARITATSELPLLESQVIVLDARQTLSKFIIDGLPNPELFFRHVGGMVERLAGVGSRLRAFGEMVALLWAEGNGAAAIQLEELWNRLAERFHFSLFCAYPLKAFRDQSSEAEFDLICQSHSHVLPTGGYLARSEKERNQEIAVLQRKALALEAEILRRKEIEEQLRQREGELREFVENASVGLHWVGPDGTILWANKADYAPLGYSEHEYIGHNITDFHADAPVIEDILARLGRGERLVDYEARLKCKDGSTRTVLVDSCVRWENGRFIHTQCFTRDITARKRSEKSLALQNLVSRILVEADSIDDAAHKILEELGGSFGWQAGAFWAIDRNEQQMRCAAFWQAADASVSNFESATRTTKLAIGSGLPGRAWQSGRPEWICDIRVDGNFPRALFALEDGLLSGFCFPVRLVEQTTGVIEFFANKVQQVDEDFCQVMAGIGSQIGQFIDRKEAEANLQAELADSKLLQEISLQIIGQAEEASLYEKLVDAAVTIMHSDFASMQMFCADHGNGELLLLATRGFSKEAADGWKWVNRTTPSSCGQVLRTGKRVIATNVQECAFLGPVGQAAYGEAGIQAMQSTPLLSRSGKLVGMISTHWRKPYRPSERDLRLFDILARQAADLVERINLVKQLREADRRKDEFLATLAHELRNPLAPIQSSLELLRRQSNNLASEEQLREMMERQVRQLSRLVDELLELSRISSGKISLKREPVDLAAVLQNAIDTSSPLIEKARHKLVLSIPHGQIMADVDPVRLSQVFTNLLNNAAKYTDANGTIEVSLRREDKQAVVSVKDNGAGIPQEMLPRVFDMFAQIDRTLNRAQGGLGIGLALARKLVELHGGRIEAESDGPGRGSEFTVRVAVLEDQPVSSGESPANGEQTCLRHCRILVVDDNRDAARALTMLLQTFKHTARAAFDGRQALEIAHDFQPDVILLDIGMPEMDGYEVARRLRATVPTGKTKLVALTGWGQEDDRRKAKEAGFDHHFVKPVHINSIIEYLGQ